MLNDKIRLLLLCPAALFSSNCLQEYGEHIRETFRTEPQEQNGATDYSA